ncbi:MAG: LysM peptidoglycan-binding domain-containing protein [Lachnospira sp.]|nr:LysM peptidoglycan-binding domain-containing protein [Lachnospira sp.]
MIEIICNGEDENKGEKSTSGKGIRVPKNIKQIGNVDSERKIYIEDYAFTYINSLAYGSPEEDHAGVLLGECQKSEDEKCIFIKGVIKAKPEGGTVKQGVIFDEKIWDRVYTEIEKYFPNLQVVGWFMATADLTAERMQYLRRVHIDNFAGNMKTLYVVNTSEKEENFYLYDEGELKKQSGYVCFYERNYEMQEYMMEVRGRQSVESPEKDKVMRSIRTIIQEKEELKQHKKNGSMMYGISAFMVVVILVLGVNILNNYEKMNRLDKSLNNITKEIATLTGNNDLVSDDEQRVVEVNKIDGNVFPTEAETVKETQVATEQETEAATERVTEKETQKATEKATEAVTSKETEAAVVVAKTHMVAKGETLNSICLKYYGTTLKAKTVAQANGLTDMDRLYIGQIIKLP